MVIVRVHWLAKSMLQTEMMTQWQVRKDAIPTINYSAWSLCTLDQV
jgi:hypothetical protein